MTKKSSVAGAATRATRKVLDAAVLDAGRATRADLAAQRLAEESETASEEGVAALAASEQLFAASDEVVALGATAGRLSQADVADGLELARMAGEIGTVGLVLAQLDMPVLAAVLDACSERLRELSAAELLRADRAGELANELVSTGVEIGALGEDEEATGMARLLVAKDKADRSTASAAAGIALAAKSSDEATRAEKLAAAAKQRAAESEPADEAAQ